MRGRRMSRAKSRSNFRGNTGTHRFNLSSRVTRGGIRL